MSWVPTRSSSTTPWSRSLTPAPLPPIPYSSPRAASTPPRSSTTKKTSTSSNQMSTSSGLSCLNAGCLSISPVRSNPTSTNTKPSSGMNTLRNSSRLFKSAYFQNPMTVLPSNNSKTKLGNNSVGQISLTTTKIVQGRDCSLWTAIRKT